MRINTFWVQQGQLFICRLSKSNYNYDTKSLPTNDGRWLP